MQDKRRYPRMDFPNAVALKTRAEQLYQGCLGRDLSRGGLRFQHHDFLPLGQDVFLQIQVDSEHIRDIRGKVVWSSQQPHSDNYMIGVEFSDPSSKSQASEHSEPGVLL